MDESSVAAAIAVAIWGFLAPLAEKASAPPPDPPAATAAAAEAEEPDEADGAVREIGEALRFVRDRYVDEVPTDELAAGAVAGLAAALDPWCERLTPKDVSEMEREDRGSYTGIGVSVSEGPNKTVLVDWPEPGSPAFRAGIRMDDRIVAVDGVLADAAGFDETVDRIGGEAGTTVEIAWERADGGGAATARVERTFLSVPTVQVARRVGDGVGFGNAMAQGTKEAVQSEGLSGVLTGPLSAGAAGITAAVLCGLIVSALKRPGAKK